MPAPDSLLNIFTCWALLSLGAALSIRAGRYFDIGSKRSLTIYLWHSIFCGVYLWYSLNGVADSTNYYLWSLEDVNFDVGTGFVVYITSFLTQILGFSYTASFLFFNIIGFIGVAAMDGALKAASQEKKRIVKQCSSIIAFLPGVNFWSTAIGKDSLSFLAVGLILWGILNFRRRYIVLIFAILIQFFIRPHVAALILLSFGIALVFDRKTSIKFRALAAVVIIPTLIAAIPFAIDYAGATAGSFDEMNDYIESRQDANMDGGGAVDISAMNPAMKIFTYIFRPLFSDGTNFTMIVASFENLFLLILTMILFNAYQRKHRTNAGGFLIVYSVLVLLVFSFTTANLGIAMRQKWVFLPMLILYMVTKSRPVRHGNLEHGRTRT